MSPLQRSRSFILVLGLVSMKENVKISHYILCIVSFIWSSEIDGLIDSISIFSCRYDDCSFINSYYLARTLNSYHKSFILGGWYKKNPNKTIMDWVLFADILKSLRWMIDGSTDLKQFLLRILCKSIITTAQ